MTTRYITTLIFAALSFIPLHSQKNDAKSQVIEWDEFGQKKLVKLSERFKIVYRKANPENSQMIFSPGRNPNEFYLVLIPDDPKIDIIPDLQDKIHQTSQELLGLKNDNSSLDNNLKRSYLQIQSDSLVMQKIQNSYSKITDDHKKQQELRSNRANRNYENDIKQNQKEINDIEFKINSNKSEYEKNADQIKYIQEKISQLGTSKQDKALGQFYKLTLDILVNKNGSLLTENNVLAIDKSMLEKEKSMFELEIKNQQTQIYLLYAGVIAIGIIAIIILFLLINKRKHNKILTAKNIEITEQKNEIEFQKAEVEKLLLNILPDAIAWRLKKGETNIIDYFSDATVIFIDIVGFTRLTSRISPKELINMLNDIFSEFDKLVEKYGLEKIKTIGDAYMAVCGVPIPRENHPELVARMALDVLKLKFMLEDGTKIQFRIGIDTGKVMAGVIGSKKFIYDLWSDTVNTASRMESHGVIDSIQISDSMKQRVEDKFEVTDRGEIEIKGKGMMKTWLLVGEKAD